MADHALIVEHFAQRKVTFGNIVLCGMRIIEAASRDDELMHGNQKLARLKLLIPDIIADLEQQGLIDARQGNELAEFAAKTQQVAEIAEALVTVAKNPEFVQLAKEVQEQVRACCIKLKKQKK